MLVTLILSHFAFFTCFDKRYWPSNIAPKIFDTNTAGYAMAQYLFVRFLQLDRLNSQYGYLVWRIERRVQPWWVLHGRRWIYIRRTVFLSHFYALWCSWPGHGSLWMAVLRGLLRGMFWRTRICGGMVSKKKMLEIWCESDLVVLRMKQ